MENGAPIQWQPQNDQQVRPIADQIRILLEHLQDEHNRHLHQLGAANQDSQIQLNQAKDTANQLDLLLKHEQQAHAVTQHSLDHEFKQLAIAETNVDEYKHRLVAAENLVQRLAFLLDPREGESSGDNNDLTQRHPVLEILQQSEEKSRKIADLEGRLFAAHEQLGSERAEFLEKQHALQDEHAAFVQEHLPEEVPMLDESDTQTYRVTKRTQHSEGEKAQDPKRKRKR